MPPDSDGKEQVKSREEFTVVCMLEKLFRDETHAAKESCVKWRGEVRM